jgi:hypothetical protein
MTHAAFVLSTGRCGTQWLASHFKRAFAEQLSVEHEPLHIAYEPRKMLKRSEPNDTSDPQKILDHADEIERRLMRGSYLECGHPCWSAIPFFARRFPGQVRVIHLVRHPAPTAFSGLTHLRYCPPLLPGIHQEKTPLSPTDEGVRFPEYRERWAALTPFEKCLYYWLEVNAFGVNQQTQLGVPWLRLRYEDLFAGDGLQRLTEFLELPVQQSTHLRIDQQVDEYRSLTNQLPDLRAIERHERVLELARKFGYDPLQVNESGLRRRYNGV